MSALGNLFEQKLIAKVASTDISTVPERLHIEGVEAAEIIIRFRDALEQAINMYIERMTAYNIKTVPKATGNLRKSGVSVLNDSKLEGNNFEVWYGFETKRTDRDPSNEEYAAFADQGRPPNPIDTKGMGGKQPGVIYPPKIARWLRAKRLPAQMLWGVLINIRQRGTKGAHFFFKGAIHARDILEQELRISLDGQGFTDAEVHL